MYAGNSSSATYGLQPAVDPWVVDSRARSVLQRLLTDRSATTQRLRLFTFDSIKRSLPMRIDAFGDRCVCI